MRLVDRTTGKLLASEVELVDTFWWRFRGLMFRRKFQRGKALLFHFTAGKSPSEREGWRPPNLLLQ